MKKIIQVLISISFLSLHSFAQQHTQTIRGIVTDESSSRPLAFANVAILNTSYSTSTDSAGHFTFGNVSVGRYTIQISMVGYEPYFATEVQVTSGKQVFLDISIKENINTLNEVVINPKIDKGRQLNSMATVSARMLSVDEATRYAGGFDDPARLVSSFAGVSSNVSNNSIVVRGNSPQSLQWKLEGVEIPNPNHFADLDAFGGGGLTALSSQLLANSDFYSGAMPAEYNNALSGVFDIFMRNGNNQKHEHTLQVGLLGIDAASEGPFKKGGKSSYLFNYRYSALALLEPLLPEEAGGTSFQDLSFKLNFPTPRAGTFTIWGIGLADRSGAKAKTEKDERKYHSDIENQDVKQYMGTFGMAHKLFLNDNQYIKSTLASTINALDMSTDRLAEDLSVFPQNRINYKNQTLVLNSFMNTKFSARHTNRTGITGTTMMYDISLDNAKTAGAPLENLVSENGYSTLLSAYSNSTLNLSNTVTLNLGVNGQLFTLNNHYTIEPRVGINYQYSANQAFSFGYGLHSRLERLNYYFIKDDLGKNLNEDLNFSKSHHFVLGYGINLTEHAHLKIETYYQHLFQIPVMRDSSFSMINQQNDWFFNGDLENNGKGRNYGIDLTFEKYLFEGYYYMLTASLFNSKYRDGNGIWHNTRYNRNYAFNFLIGKEWNVGRNDKNVLGLNARLSYQGGERHSPIDLQESQQRQDAIFDESYAFSKQLSPAFTSHFTTSYKINKMNSSHEIAFKVLNASMHKEFMGFDYNYQTKAVDEIREALFIPNLSYKIEF